MHDRSSYEYEQLHSDSSFRVLEILPGKKNHNLTFRLHVANRDDAPAFEALSYAWGDPETRITASCDGSVIPITTNLSDGMQAMRHERHLRFLWADAVCIDQKNMKERGHQVSIIQCVQRLHLWSSSGQSYEDDLPEISQSFGLARPRRQKIKQ